MSDTSQSMPSARPFPLTAEQLTIRQCLSADMEAKSSTAERCHGTGEQPTLGYILVGKRTVQILLVGENQKRSTSELLLLQQFVQLGFAVQQPSGVGTVGQDQEQPALGRTCQQPTPDRLFPRNNFAN